MLASKLLALLTTPNINCIRPKELQTSLQDFIGYCIKGAWTRDNLSQLDHRDDLIHSYWISVKTFDWFCGSWEPGRLREGGGCEAVGVSKESLSRL